MGQVGRTFEGQWDEIALHADELQGCRIRLTVVAEPVASALGDGMPEKNRRMLAALEEIGATQLTDEENKILDNIEEFRERNPFRLRKPWELGL